MVASSTIYPYSSLDGDISGDPCFTGDVCVEWTLMPEGRLMLPMGEVYVGNLSAARNASIYSLNIFAMGM